MTVHQPVRQTATEAMAPHCRVLIVDDSAVARAVLGRLVDGSDRWVVSRSVPTVAGALAFLASDRVDFILLDINMPGVDGLTALPDLIAAAPGAKVIVVSSDEAAGVQALAMGAAYALTKPGPAGHTRQFGARLLDCLARLSPMAAAELEPQVVPPAAAAPMPSLPGLIQPASGTAFDLLAIGASTGGIHALSGMLRQLPASFRLPILVTQHLPPSFMPYFAAQLALLAGRPCEVATDRMRVRHGRIVVAPGDAHMVGVALADGGTAIRLSHAPSTSGCMPSVDPMLASLAPIHGDRLIAVVLSGMGRDGAEGARVVHAAGGCVVAQDSGSSVVWGMPGAVVAAGIADAVLTPDEIGALVASGRRPQ